MKPIDADDLCERLIKGAREAASRGVKPEPRYVSHREYQHLLLEAREKAKYGLRLVAPTDEKKMTIYGVEVFCGPEPKPEEPPKPLKGGTEIHGG